MCVLGYYHLLVHSGPYFRSTQHNTDENGINPGLFLNFFDFSQFLTLIKNDFSTNFIPPLLFQCTFLYSHLFTNISLLYRVSNIQYINSWVFSNVAFNFRNDKALAVHARRSVQKTWETRTLKFPIVTSPIVVEILVFRTVRFCTLLFKFVLEDIVTRTRAYNGTDKKLSFIMSIPFGHSVVNIQHKYTGSIIHFFKFALLIYLYALLIINIFQFV